MWGETEGDRIRELIKHESEVLNHRITWLIAFNGLLFAALGFAWEEAGGIVKLLSFLGIAGSTVLAPSVIFADIAISQLVETWNKEKDSNYNVPVIGLRTHKAWCVVWWAIPMIFDIAWIAVLFVH